MSERITRIVSKVEHTIRIPLSKRAEPDSIRFEVSFLKSFDTNSGVPIIGPVLLNLADRLQAEGKTHFRRLDPSGYLTEAEIRSPLGTTTIQVRNQGEGVKISPHFDSD